MKRILTWLAVLVMLFGCVAAAAAEGAGARQQIVSGADVEAATVTNNAAYDDVVISKTIAATGEENVFDITLKVTTKEEIKTSTEAPDVAVVLVLDTSNSMGRTAINQMCDAAGSFLTSFANGAEGGARKASIVTYNQSVVLEQNWEDAASIPALDSNKLYNASTDRNVGYATNIHGGLLRAQSLLQESAYDGKAASEFEYTYVVLMTDGEPTSYMSSTPSANGNWMGVAYNPNDSRCKTYAQNAAAALETLGAEVYAVGYNLNNNGANWLKNNIASTTSHYFYASTDGLKSQFEAIANAMKISASAWIVTDPMAEGIQLLSYDDAGAITRTGNTLEWNLRATTPSKSTSGNVTTYTYTTTYRVKLDTLVSGFAEGKDYATNGRTSLTYWIEQDGQYLNNDHQVIESPNLDNAIMTMYFEVPVVEGFVEEDLTFAKVDDAGKPIEGVAFTATVKDGNWSKTAVSGPDGVVTIENIPSGHTYTLTETKPEGYVASEPIEFEVNYGEADYTGFDTNASGDPVVINTRETGDAYITVTKVFEGVDEADLPVSLEVTAVNQDDAELSYSATLYQADGYTAEITVLAPGTYTVTETVPVIEGYNLESTTYTTPNTDNTASVVTVAIDGTAEVTVTNTYNKQEADLTLIKTFAGDQLTEEQMNGVTFTVTGPDNYSNTIAYSNFAEDGTYTLTGLALGEYTVTESANVDGYTVSTQYSASTITLEDGAVGEITITNTYNKQEGGLVLQKVFTGDHETLTAEQKNGITFTVTGPNNYSKVVTYGEFTDGQYSLGNLPLGTYTVAESNAEFPGYVLTATYGNTQQSRAIAQDHTVTIDDDADHTVTITNDYNKQEAELTITKTFAGDKLTAEQLKGITFTVTGPADFEQTVSYADFNNGSYTFTGLELGEYSVTESAQVEGYVLTTEYTVNGQNTSNITLADADKGVISITNTYNKQEGGLVIAKTFSGDAIPEEAKAKITFTVTGPRGFEKQTVTYSEFTDGQYSFGNVPLGTYTIVESNADVEGYIRTSSHIGAAQPLTRAIAAPTTEYTATVEVKDDTGYIVDINNNYNKQEADLTISKTFAGELEEVTDEYKNAITFTVTGPDGFEQTVSYADFTNGSYTFTGLALGEYTVAEGNADLAHYTVTATGAGSVTLADGDKAQMNVINTYAADPGNLKVTKVFGADSALTAKDFPNGIKVTATAVDGGQTYTATLSADNSWTHTFEGLVPGNYTVTEESTHDANYYSFSAVFSGVAEGSVATVQPGMTRATEVTITNTYTLGEADELVIPFEKIVGLGEGGNTPPMGETTFYYTLDLGLAQSMQRSAVQPGTLEVSYKGGVEASDVPAYDFKVTVNGPNTAEGWIVIRGNAYDLQRLTVTITESEFGMTKRWTYESGSDYAWTVDAQQQADGSFKAVMTRADGKQGAKVSFLNKYTFVSEVPATGDHSQLLLWAVLMAVSAAGFTLLHKRRERRDH